MLRAQRLRQRAVPVGAAERIELDQLEARVRGVDREVRIVPGSRPRTRRSVWSPTGARAARGARARRARRRTASSASSGISGRVGRGSDCSMVMAFLQERSRTGTPRARKGASGTTSWRSSSSGSRVRRWVNAMPCTNDSTESAARSRSGTSRPSVSRTPSAIASRALLNSSSRLARVVSLTGRALEHRAEDQEQGLAALDHQPAQARDEAVEPRLDAAHLVHARADLLDPRLGHARERGVEQALLALEVPVEGGLHDPGALAHVGDRGAREAALREQPDRGGQDPLAGELAVGGGRRPGPLERWSVRHGLDSDVYVPTGTFDHAKAYVKGEVR